MPPILWEGRITFFDRSIGCEPAKLGRLAVLAPRRAKAAPSTHDTPVTSDRLRSLPPHRSSRRLGSSRRGLPIQGGRSAHAIRCCNLCQAPGAFERCAPSAGERQGFVSSASDRGTTVEGRAAASPRIGYRRTTFSDPASNATSRPTRDHTSCPSKVTPWIFWSSRGRTLRTIPPLFRLFMIPLRAEPRALGQRASHPSHERAQGGTGPVVVATVIARMPEKQGTWVLLMQGRTSIRRSERLGSNIRGARIAAPRMTSPPVQAMVRAGPPSKCPLRGKHARSRAARPLRAPRAVGRNGHAHRAHPEDCLRTDRGSRAGQTSPTRARPARCITHPSTRSAALDRDRPKCRRSRARGARCPASADELPDRRYAQRAMQRLVLARRRCLARPPRGGPTCSSRRSGGGPPADLHAVACLARAESRPCPRRDGRTPNALSGASPTRRDAASASRPRARHARKEPPHPVARIQTWRDIREADLFAIEEVSRAIVLSTDAAVRHRRSRTIPLRAARAVALSSPRPRRPASVPRDEARARAFETRRVNTSHRSRLRVEIGRLEGDRRAGGRAGATSKGYVPHQAESFVSSTFG